MQRRCHGQPGTGQNPWFEGERSTRIHIPGGPRARGEAFPQYDALFVRRQDGEVVLWAGKAVDFDVASVKEVFSELG